MADRRKINKNKPAVNDMALSTQYADNPISSGNPNIVIQDLTIMEVNRTTVGIEKWRTALRTAESRYQPDRAWLYDMYADIYLDGHLAGIVAKRIDSVLNKKLLYYDAKGERVKEMEAFMNTKEFRRIQRTIMETIMWGISGLEFIPGEKLHAREIPRKHIKPKWQRITFEQNGTEGIDYTDLKNIWIIGEPEDLGLFLKCCPYVIYKRNMWGSWATYIEIFGQPIRVMYYDPANEQGRMQLKSYLDKSGNAIALMIPKGTEFDIKDGKISNGDGQLQERFKDACNQENSILILGNTETTTNGKTGSQAKSKVHQDQQDEITRSDIAYMEHALNEPHFIEILKSYNWPVVDGGSFRFSPEINIEYLESRIAIDIQMPEDLPIDDDYWYNTYFIPKPENYDELKAELKEKQKVEKEATTIEADPVNKPAQKPRIARKQKKVMAVLAKLFPDFFA